MRYKYHRFFCLLSRLNPFLVLFAVCFPAVVSAAPTCTSLGGGVYQCSGSGNSPIYLDADTGTGDLIVKTTFATTGNVWGYNAIDLTGGSGTLSFIDNYASTFNGNGSFGIYATHASTESVVIKSTGTIEGTGYTPTASNNGIYLEGDSTLTAVTDSVTIDVNNVSGVKSGIYSIYDKTVGDFVITTNGTITGSNLWGIGVSRHYGMSSDSKLKVVANGDVSGGMLGTGLTAGITLNNLGLGSVEVTSYGTVESGITGSGIHTRALGSASDITITAYGKVAGGIYGIVIDNAGFGDIQVTAEKSVTAPGTDGIGISVFSSSTHSGKITISALETVSGTQYGIRVNSASTGLTTVSTGGDVSGGTSGIYVNSSGGYDVDINGGTVSATTPAYGTIHIMDSNGGFVDIASGAGINAGAVANIALRDGDEDQDGTDETTGNMIVTSAGTVTGSAILGLGNDTITLAGGSWTGDIHGDDLTSSVNDGDDIFTWSGGSFTGTFYGESGSDSATISSSGYDGTQVFDGGDDTSVADGYIDRLTFSGVTATTTGSTLINWEKVTFGASSLTVTGTLAVGDGTDDTGVFLENATLDGGSGLTLAGNLSIDASSTFVATNSGSGYYSVTNGLKNAGTINMIDGAAGDNVVVGGNYSGNGTLALDVDFSTSTADTLTVHGAASASGTIAISDLKSTGTDSSDEILLVDETTDTNKSDENFVLAAAHRYNGNSDLGRFDNSPFIWKLKTSGNDWVLGYAYDAPVEDEPGEDEPVADNPGEDTPGTADEPSGSSSSKPAVVSEIPAYVSVPVVSYEIVVNKLDTLHQRMGELRNHSVWAEEGVRTGVTNAHSVSAEELPEIDFDEEKTNGWVKAIYAEFDFDNDDNFAVDGNLGLTQLGVDRKIVLNERDTIFAGVNFSSVRGEFDNDGTGDEYGSLYSADGKLDGKSAGVYATWFNTKGTYVDVVADYMMLDADLEAVCKYSIDGTMISGSVEVGHDFIIRQRVIVEPQAQVKVAHIEWDGFHDGWSDVVFEDHTYVTGRLGVRVEYTHSCKDAEEGRMAEKNVREIKPWLYLGVQDEFTDGATVLYAATPFDSQDYDATANIQAGVTVDINKHLQIYGDAGYTTDFSQYNSWRADAGLRVKW